MKKYIYILIIFITTFNAIGQETIVNLSQQGILDEDENTTYYYKDVIGNLNKFLGTWKYQDANKELIITTYLNTHIYSNGLGNYYDDIYIKFKYTENGTIIYNNLIDNSSSAEKIIYRCSIFPDNLNLISLIYREPTNLPFGAAKEYADLDIEYLPCTGLGCQPQLKWHIFWSRNRDTDVWPWKIPKDLILTKQP
jgi:hypothetical protein